MRSSPSIDSAPSPWTMRPLLLSATRIDPVSRYDLGALAFGMNIERRAGWSGLLTLSCQVRSDGVTWPVADTVIQPDSRNGNLVLFTARVNLTGAGNPRDPRRHRPPRVLATGSDDAGRTLTAQANNDPDFPWIDLTLTGSSTGPRLGAHPGRESHTNLSIHRRYVREHRLALGQEHDL